MIVIIEGMDRCFKDGIIRHLRKSVLTSPLTTMIHCSSTPKGEDPSSWPKIHYHELFYQCKNLSERGGWDIILNRAHIGENVYGPIFRNAPAEWIFDLEKLLLSDCNVILFTIVDDPVALLAREDGVSLYDNIGHIQSVRDAFIDTYCRSNIKNKHLHDHSLYPKDEQIDRLISLVEKEVRNAKS